MRTGTIGSLRVTKVGLGCNNFGARLDKKKTEAVVLAALEQGITFFDTADIYGNRGLSEEYLGAALRGRRHQVVVGTKFGHEMMGDAQSGGSARWIALAVEDSLRRLGTDYIDLYQMHTPDPTVPIEETLEALASPGRTGQSPRDRMLELHRRPDRRGNRGEHAKRNPPFRQRPEPLQPPGPWVERDVVPACARNGLSVMPYCPLASGVLTGKYRRGEEPPKGTRMDWVRNDPATSDRGFLSDRSLEIVDRLQEYAADHGRTLIELALSWLAAQPDVSTVIPRRKPAGAGSHQRQRRRLAPHRRPTRRDRDHHRRVGESREILGPYFGSPPPPPPFHGSSRLCPAWDEAC